MIFFDINTFYYASDGGIKTFYSAKINWFLKNPEYQYYLIYPDRQFKINKIAPNVHLVSVFGLKGIIGKNRLLIADYWRVLKLIKSIKPDVIESGDPLLTGLFSSLVLRFRLHKGFWACFHHSNPIDTYARPWASGKNSSLLKRLIAHIATAVYRFNQNPYHLNMAASQTMKEGLEKFNIQNTIVKPFGVDEIFIKRARVRKNSTPKHILFSGRLVHEKGIHLIKKILPELLEIDNVYVIVMGKGEHEHFFKGFKHPKYQYLGYIDSREMVEQVYNKCTFFLAPGPYETFGIGVLEALANGMIVIGPSAGGTGELLAQLDSPFIFEANDKKSFLETVKKALICDYETESQRSLNKARDFLTWSEAIGKMVHTYEKQALAFSKNKKLYAQKSPDFIT